MELLIRNAKVLDLDSGRERLADVAVEGSAIAAVEPAGTLDGPARQLIQAEGRYLLPGFIDYHTHLFAHGSGFGLDADLLLSAGVTTAVDMGTAGWVNYPALHCCDLVGKKLRLYSYLNISPIGQPGKGINEPLDDGVLSLDKMREVMAAYPEEIRGLKVRVSRSIVKELGLAPLRRAVEFGAQLGLPVCVHTTDPAEGSEAVAACLRPGDVYSHVYQHKGSTILGEDGQVRPGLLAARQRGVLMEVGNGRVNFSFAVAAGACAQGFYPDIISSDSTPATFHKEPAMWDLPRVMSKFLALGMPFPEVVRAVTATPARRLGLGDRLGKLAPGCPADLVLCQLKEERVTFADSEGQEREGRQLLVPHATFLGGRLAYSGE